MQWADLPLVLTSRNLHHHSVQQFASLQVTQIDLSYREHVKLHITYGENAEVYDSGKMLTVACRHNDDPYALENWILQSNVDELPTNYEDQVEGRLLDHVEKVLPSISFFYPTVTLVTFKTVDGILTHTVTEDIEAFPRYLHIPPGLFHIVTVPITQLRRMQDLSLDVDRIKWNDQEYAFKKVGTRLEQTLKELEILDILSDSPYIINLSAIVINLDHTIRGFLMPYMYAGNLENVLLTCCRSPLAASGELVLDFSIKHTWARQITHGVVDLHSIRAYNGNLKPQNIVIGSEFQAILIDFLPTGISAPFAAPEVMEKLNDPDTTLEDVLSGPADVYSLGLILYALSQGHAEAADCDSLVWRQGSAPRWYMDVVMQCLYPDPSGRPSAAEVLNMLEEGET